jgi:ABC-2 type transport system permease protein
MTSVRLFLHGCLFQYKALFTWATPVGYLTSKIAQPIFQLIFFVELGTFATGGRTGIAYFTLGNALQLTALNGVFGVAMTLASERYYGTLPLLIASPANRLSIFFGRALMHILDGMGGVALGLVVSVVLFGLDLSHADLLLLAACIILISMTTAGLGLMLGSIGLITRDILLIANGLYFLLLLVCGVNVPINSLPHWLQFVSFSLPMTRGVEAAREAVSGASFGRVWQLLAAEVAIGVLYVSAGYVLFRWLEGRSRRGGLQEVF